ncbi:MAG: WavE lipopolysaccharide synthesis family protein [Alphaproteobacteria bacterium]|nr:WavE lipopolysaccharide synthesis family protein [Alphaproteobacteria bacterium]
MIALKDISVVVQGDINKELTHKCLRNIRKHLPEAELILSTWENSDIKGLEYNKIIFNKDVGCFLYSDKQNEKTNNVNRQIVSTLSGLKEASRPYILKIRTDFILTGKSFLKFFDKFPKVDENYCIFNHKILDLCYFARNPRDKKVSYPFHPSDIALFGLSEDILNLYDIPLMPQEEEFYWEYKGNKFNRYVPEQYIFIHCLWKNGHNINFKHQRDNRNKIIELTERYFASNFVFIDFRQFNILPPKKFINGILNDYRSCITYVEWQKLYKEYVDNTLFPCLIDKERKRIERIYHSAYFCKFIARLVVLPIIGKTHKELRKKIRTKISLFLERILFYKIY